MILDTRSNTISLKFANSSKTKMDNFLKLQFLRKDKLVLHFFCIHKFKKTLQLYCQIHFRHFVSKKNSQAK